MCMKEYLQAKSKTSQSIELIKYTDTLTGHAQCIWLF